MNYWQRRRICRDYYAKCRQGRKDKRKGILKSLFSGKKEDDGCRRR